MKSKIKETPNNKRSQKYLIENNNKREKRINTDNNNIYEYKGNTHDNQRLNKSEKFIDITPNNIIKRVKTNINNNDNMRIHTIEYLSEKEDLNYQRKYSLNKGRNTLSTNIINNRIKNRVDLSNNNYRKNIKYNQNKNDNIKISGFELCYESDKGERNSYNNILNKTKNHSKNNEYKYNNIYYTNINLDLDDKNNEKINNKEKNGFRYEIKVDNKMNKSYIKNNDNSFNKNNNSIIPINNKRNTRNTKNIIFINKNKIDNNTSIKINQNKRNINFRNFHRPSEIKKIILIQSTYRKHLAQIKLDEYKTILMYYNEFFELLNDIIIDKKEKLWKYFKLCIKSRKKKEKKNNKKLMNTKKKILMKATEVKMLHKELGDSFNIKNDDLKIKLDDIIKENNELKNQIFDNKNIEEKMKQLLEENKKNQSINAIIMKDNKQLAKRLKNIQENRNNQLVVENQIPVDLTQDTNIQTQSINKLKYLYLKCIFFKKVLKNKNSLKIYFNKYRNNIKKLRKKYSIENNNIFINNKKKINIQMAKNLNINFISQNDNYKHFILHKLFMKKEQKQLNIIPKYFYKYYYISKYINEKEEEKEEMNIKKNKILKAIIMKKENKNEYILRKIIKEWKLRGIIFKMKGVAKELKKKKKLKKKIRDKIAKATLNNLKNKTANFQSAHEFSYKIDKIDKKEDNKEENIIKEDKQTESDESF